MFQLTKMTQKNKKQWQAGMTYVELIVVLSIFAVLSGVVLFNYGEFQSKVDLKNLASDIALKVIEAQKASLSGKLPPAGYTVTSTWKPSYGVYFNIIPPPAGTGDNKSFIYFADLDDLLLPPPSQNSFFDGSFISCTVECLEKIDIKKGNYISKIEVFGSVTSTPNNLAVVFSRINSGMTFSSGNVVLPNDVSHVQITLTSPKSTTAKIILYPSGRVQID